MLKTTLVSGPGSTRADPAPPSQAELTAERAAMALLNADKPGSGAFLPRPAQWIYRKLGTSRGAQEVWARADDTEQASYVHGTLVTCARSATCASGTRWLMPTGPAYPVVYPAPPEPGGAGSGPTLPDNPQALLGTLNTYRTGCADAAGYCNAVGVFANMLICYGNAGMTPLTWYFSLADVPGVTVQRITDGAPPSSCSPACLRVFLFRPHVRRFVRSNERHGCGLGSRAAGGTSGSTATQALVPVTADCANRGLGDNFLRALAMSGVGPGHRHWGIEHRRYPPEAVPPRQVTRAAATDPRRDPAWAESRS